MINTSYTLYRKLLDEIITLKTISTLGSNTEINRAVEWYKTEFQNHGFDVDIVTGYDNPVVLAEINLNENFETILIYGHYDVQPADEEEWGYNPFVITEKNNRLYARGVADNKGQSLVHIATVFDLLNSDELKFNVKFIIEGNEETGSPNISKLLSKYKNKLSSDIILLSDGDILPTNPLIEISMRGVMNTSLTLKTADHEVHSGSFGGIMPNAAHEASKLMAKIYSENRHIQIEHFYDDVEELDLEGLITSDLDEKTIKKITGAKILFKESGHSYATQVGLRPSFELTSFKAGYLGKGYRNSVPNKAVLKFNIRLAPGQKPERVLEQFKIFVESNLPGYVSYTFPEPDESEGVVEAMVFDYKNKATQKTVNCLESVYESEVLFSNQGAVVPIAKHLKEILDGDLVVVPLANYDCNMHAVDENFDLQILEKALRFSRKFLSEK